MIHGEFYFVEEGGIPVGKTALLDAFAQSDVDMRGFHIVNCPDLGAIGTVQSVGLSMPPQFVVTNSPVTIAGTLSVFWQSVGARQFLGNGSGVSGVPSFQAIGFNMLSGAVVPSQGGLPVGGTTGQQLTKNSGSDYDASWQAPAGPPGLPPATRSFFLTSATAVPYVPSASVRAILVECWGSGGGGASCNASTSNNSSAAGGGGGGGYSRLYISGTIQASYQYNVPDITPADTDGVDTTFQIPVSCSADGGSAGGTALANGAAHGVTGSANGGFAGNGVGDFRLGGNAGGPGVRLYATGSVPSEGWGGQGGGTPFLIGNNTFAIALSGRPGTYGQGGNGAFSTGGQGAGTGGTGGAGLIRITEIF